MRFERKTTVLVLALVVLAALAVPATIASTGKVIVEGKGWINSTVMPNKSLFAFAAESNNSVVNGELGYNDTGAHIKILGNVKKLSINATTMTADFAGVAVITNATGAKTMTIYAVKVRAGGKGQGVFGIIVPPIPSFLPKGYSDIGKLQGGNISIK